MSQWQPIETVPMMTDVLLWDGTSQNVGHCDMTDYDGYYDEPVLASNIHGGWLDAEDYQPTHWMPLPEPPK